MRRKGKMAGLCLVLLTGFGCKPATESVDGPKALSLKDTITTNGVKSVDQLLTVLDADLLAHPVLLHVSGSKHVASYDAPRILLHSSDGKLALAFNSGVSGQTGDQSLEIMEYQDEDASFAFSEIKFPLDQVGDPDFSEKNPARCIGCHDLPARPNWSSYPSWPGAYGGEGDHIAPGSPEGQGLKSFLASYKQHPRYRYLQAVESRYAMDASGKLTATPNGKLLELFSALNVKRIAAEVKKQAAYAKHRDDVVKLLSGCGAKGDLVQAGSALGFAFDVPDWTMHFLGTDDQARRPLDGPGFQDSAGDYLQRGFFKAAAELDPELNPAASPCS